MDNNDFILKIVAELEKKGIKTGYDKLKKELEKDPAKIDVILNTSGTVGKTKGSIKKLAAELHNELSVEIAKLQKQGQNINFDLSVGDVEEVIQNVINHTKKLEQNFDSASAKAQKFLSQFNKKSGGTLISSAEYKAVQEAIDGLGNTHSIDDLNKSMNTLEITYNNMVSNLRNGGKSLNPFINAINDMKNMDSTLKGIELDFQSLSSKPKAVADSIKDLHTQQQKVNQYSQGTVEWAQEYGILQSKIVQVKNEIQNVAKAEKASNTDESNRVTYYQRIIDNNKTVYSLKNKLLTADKEQTAEINRQIKALEERNRYNEKQLSKKGLTDNSWEQSVNSSKSALENQLRINTAKQEDIAITKALAKAKKEAANMDNGYGSSEYQNQIDKTLASLKQYGAEAQVIEKINTDLQSTFDSMKGLSGQELNNQADVLKQKLEAAKVSIDEAKLSYDKLMQPASTEKISSTLLKVQKLLSNNTRVTEQVAQEWQSYVNRLSSGSNIAEKEIKDINIRLKETESQMRSMGRFGLSWTDKLKKAWGKFSGWGFATGTMMTLFNQLRKIPEEVIKINSAMIELRKVSNASDNEIKNYFDEAAESAKKLGASVSDLINATADWSRLGYSLPDSKKLAEIATLYTHVGDGIDMSAANESLISTLKGFQLETEDAMGIIDKFNEVANNFPIDSAGIGEALQRSAASFYAANTDLSKSIALITGTNAVVQDPDSVGNMWKTVSMRIRGTKQELEEAGEETDGMVESTTELRDLIKGLTGFDIMADEAGTQFKDVYDIVVGIGHEWKNLTDVEQAGLLETLAGKRQGNALSAALNNVSMIEEAYKTAENSAGSALREQEEYEKGIQYSLDRLEASFQTFANHILDSNFLKGIVDFGNGAINVIDKVTSALSAFGTIGLGVGITAFVKNFA